ncbi:MAG: hypothetical protein E7321_01910 [Clostridiales bacterium]|nr:hypothetical protein [Clostridiales bacterium]
MKKILTVMLLAAMLLTLTATALAATGVGSATTVSAAAATADAAGSVTVTTTMCAVTLDDEGKFAAVAFDVIESKAGFDATGAIAGEVNAAPQTKAELGEAYGMKAISPIGKEWYEQMDALAAWCVGKTPAEVLGMAFGADGKPTDADLTSGCTIYINDQLKALEKAVAAAK